MDSIVGVQDVSGTMWATPALFKISTNFKLEEFDKLAFQMVPTIKAHVRSIGKLHLSYFMFSILIYGA
jgi:hypothetical protein